MLCLTHALGCAVRARMECKVCKVFGASKSLAVGNMQHCRLTAAVLTHSSPGVERSLLKLEHPATECN